MGQAGTTRLRLKAGGGSARAWESVRLRCNRQPLPAPSRRADLGFAPIGVEARAHRQGAVGGVNMQDASRARTWKAGHLAHVALVAMTAAVLIPSLASAQIFDPLRGYGFDGSPAAAQPQQQRGPRVREDAPAREARVARPLFASATHVRHIAERNGFRLTSAPQRRGQGYVATAERDNGHRFELTFNAFNGSIVGARDLGAIMVAKAPPAPAPAAAGAGCSASAGHRCGRLARGHGRKSRGGQDRPGRHGRAPRRRRASGRCAPRQGQARRGGGCRAPHN